ncbi:MAG: type II secretion system protein [Rickettsiales bacterium]
MTRKITGFSLVELSIVLVILGLLTGGILAGQSLIRAAQLRAVSTEYSRYATAVNTFKDKYFAIPGDMNSATQFWGRLNGNADCVTNSSAAVNAAAGACDGNSDGLVNVAGYTAASAGVSGESFQFWRELALAGLIEGSYSGVDGPAGGYNIVAANSPPTKSGNGYWGMRGDFGTLSGHPQYFDATYGNFYWFQAGFKPEEVWNIDTKLDDGKPATGIMINNSWANTCTTAANSADKAAAYRLTETSLICFPLFIKQ